MASQPQAAFAKQLSCSPILKYVRASPRCSSHTCVALRATPSSGMHEPITAAARATKSASSSVGFGNAGDATGLALHAPASGPAPATLPPAPVAPPAGPDLPPVALPPCPGSPAFAPACASLS